jgi:plasmid stability protein
VATLNVKNLPDSLHRKLQKRAKARHRSVAQEVTSILEELLERPRPVSILGLRGLGRELWSETDAVAHVEAERRSWD